MKTEYEPLYDPQHDTALKNITTQMAPEAIRKVQDTVRPSNIWYTIGTLLHIEVFHGSQA